MNESPLRITQVMLAKGFGGAERSFVDTCLALADRGHRVQAICHRGFVKQSLLTEHPGVEVVRVNVRGAWDPLAVRAIRTAVRRFEPDAVHSHLARGTHLAGRAVGRWDVPLVCKLHNYANLAYYRYVSHFIGTTPDQRRYLLDHNVIPSSISVIPNFSRLRPVCAPRLQGGGPLRLVTCGRLNPVKGFDVLLRAVRIASDRGVDVRLLIGGGGDEEARLRTLCDELSLTDRVEFAGWTDDVPALLDRGDAYVLSSRAESFGIALIEAMSRGLPVITTRTKGPSQILGADDAWFAEPEDAESLAAAIAAAAGDPRLRAERATRSLEIFRDRYAEAGVVDRIEAVYRRLSDGGRFVMVGGVRVDPQFAAAFGQRYWDDASSVLDAAGMRVFRQADERACSRLTLADGTGTSHVLFLKRHTGSDAAVLSAGDRELAAAVRCRRAGVPVVRAIAAGRNADASKGSTGSFVASCEAGGGLSATDLSKSWRADRADREKTARLRTELIAATAATSRRLHAAGLFHRDLYWDHFFPVRDASGDVTAELIDVQRVRQPKTFVGRFTGRLKDLAQIQYSMQQVGLSDEDRKQFNRLYFTQRPDGRLPLSQRLLLRLAEFRQRGRATRLIARRDDRFRRGGSAVEEIGPPPYASEIPTRTAPAVLGAAARRQAG